MNELFDSIECAKSSIEIYKREKEAEVMSLVECYFRKIGCDKWSHEEYISDGQFKRFEKAVYDKIKVKAFDEDNLSATVAGSEGSYDVTLTSCTCYDFANRKLPCKHIYKLLLLLND